LSYLLIQPTMNLSILLIFGLGTTELLLIALVVLLLFGGKKIPELMKGLGKGVKSFKDGMTGLEEEMNKTGEKDPPASTTEKK
jgi:sec-independent protein translocase protein TatA